MAIDKFKTYLAKQIDKDKKDLVKLDARAEEIEENYKENDGSASYEDVHVAQGEAAHMTTRINTMEEVLKKYNKINK